MNDLIIFTHPVPSLSVTVPPRDPFQRAANSPTRRDPSPGRGFLIALAMLLAAPALAQDDAHGSSCGPRTKVIYNLANKFLESPLDEGLQISGPVVFEFWGNTKTGTWTIIKTDLKGQTCIMAAGQSLNHLDYRHPDEPL